MTSWGFSSGETGAAMGLADNPPPLFFVPILSFHVQWIYFLNRYSNRLSRV